MQMFVRVSRSLCAFICALTVVLTTAHAADSVPVTGFRGGNTSWRLLSLDEDGYNVRFTVRQIFTGTEAQLVGLDVDYYDGHYANIVLEGTPTILQTGLDLAGEQFVVVEWTKDFHYSYEAAVCYGNCFLSYFGQLEGGRVPNAVNAPNGGFVVATTINLNGKNSGSPVVNMPPILNVELGKVNVFPLSITDPDNDKVKCKISDQYVSQIPGGAGAGGKISVSENCVLTVDATEMLSLQKYATQVWIEELREGCPTIFAVDFLIQVTPKNNQPICSGTSGKIIAPIGQKFVGSYVGTDSDGGELTVRYQGLPTAAVATPPHGSVGVSPMNAGFEWTPTASDVGANYNIAVLFNDVGGLEGSCTVQLEVKDTSCQSTDISATLLALDGGVNSQNLLAQSLVRKIKKATGNRLLKRDRTILIGAQAAYEAAWRSIYADIPQTVTKCADTTICSSVDLSAGVTKYITYSSELDTMLKKLVRRLASVTGRKISAYRAYTKAANRAQEENVATAGSVPGATNSCS